MSALYFLLVAEAFALGLMWHNKSPRPEKEHEAERPDRQFCSPIEWEKMTKLNQFN